ncbi:PAS domain S-box [Desulfosporosinus orientis DSM 765]|uniref:histidine kinase n=1 Tax=Desulfosporosinus orientis (strain ATCC 19365 / DSM 765 / NCIMB 8382 / VKM B-1628 / Singapore I) TaxID=768706 RepID=G7W944_DESOD|nr:PocR ligand-binding domain-containing protein [Desulfosporosinus orientis]AET68685.1 PAS domain S-box [Desulfosporosinus orientis DSM 765]
MKYCFSELVNVSDLQNFLNSLFSISNPVLAILDNNSNILVSFGWQEICVNYHRLNSETALLCKQSDRYIKNYLNCNEPYICYRCANGLIDAAAPIIIEGEHIATAYHGQFFFEEPDKEQFRMQAKKYGFNEEEYLKALAKVPIYSKKELDKIMFNIRQLIETMAKNGLAYLKLIEAKSEERLKTIINNTTYMAIQSYDFDGRIQYFNNASKSMFGCKYNKKIEENLNQIMISDKKISFDCWKDLKSNNKEKIIKDKEWIFQNENGVEKIISSTIFPINLPDGKREFISMDIDITEKKRFEKEMQRLDRLNIIGEMAAGIAHEVRNPMTTVRGYLQLLKNKQEFQEFQNQMELMIDEIDRANAIITEFLTLAKTKPNKPENRNLNDIIQKLYPLIEADVFTQNKQINFRQAELPNIIIDENEISQMILNLTRNAMESMKENGLLTIETYLNEDNKVILKVQDQGCGIPQEIIDKIGTPFFTTKDNGTGLGLATTYRIAESHNAKIEVESDDKGTAFYVYFPVTDNRVR